MPSFVVHYVSGELLLKKILNVKMPLDNNSKDFRTGNLIADSTPKLTEYINSLPKNIKKDNQLRKEIYLRKQKEKNITHFRGELQTNKIIRVPNLKLFIDKYNKELISGKSIFLGYLFHLYIDNKFFTKIFPKSFTIYNNNQTNKKIVILKHSKNKITLENLLSKYPGGIYYDYTVLNKIILEKYPFVLENKKLSYKIFNENDNLIKEVENCKIDFLIDKANKYITQSFELNNKLHVLNEDEVLNTINEMVEDFYNCYKNYIDICFK